MKIIDKLSTYAALIGVVSAIGGGFYAWGEFNTRLSAIEDEPPVNTITDQIDDKTIRQIRKFITFLKSNPKIIKQFREF